MSDIIAFDVLENATHIQNIFGEYFIEPPVGIYLHSKATPVIIPGEKYFTQSSFKSLTPIDPLEQTSAIYDINGVLVISDFIMKNKKKFLKDTPNYPVVAIKFIEHFIKTHLDRICPYSDSIYNYKEMKKLLKPEYVNPEDKDHDDHPILQEIESYLDSLTILLLNFIGQDFWAIYDVKTKGTSVIIEKGVDYRVNEWMIDHGYQS